MNSLAMPVVLVAHGDKAENQLLAQDLTARGLQVVTANDGFEAVLLTCGAAVAALVVQADLPGLTAIEVLEALRLRQPEPLAAWFVAEANAHGMLACARAIESGFIPTAALFRTELCHAVERTARLLAALPKVEADSPYFA